MMTGQGKTKSYFHRLKIVDSPMCPCDSGEQSLDHILFSCQLLQKQRQTLRKIVIKADNWPPNKAQILKTSNRFHQFNRLSEIVKY